MWCGPKCAGEFEVIHFGAGAERREIGGEHGRFIMGSIGA
jgi:hypothetical protein